jgi:uncharacterized membrane protein YeiH
MRYSTPLVRKRRRAKTALRCGDGVGVCAVSLGGIEVSVNERDDLFSVCMIIISGTGLRDCLLGPRR